MAKKYPDCQWDLQQIRNFVESAKSRVGKQGWVFLSKPMREGLIAQDVLRTLLVGQDDAELQVKWIRDLYHAMRSEAGLIDEDEE